MVENGITCANMVYPPRHEVDPAQLCYREPVVQYLYLHYILAQLILHSFVKGNLLSKYDLFSSYSYATHLYSY